MIDQDPEITLQKVTEKCQRLINVKRETKYTDQRKEHFLSPNDKTTEIYKK